MSGYRYIVVDNEGNPEPGSQPNHEVDIVPTDPNTIRVPGTTSRSTHVATLNGHEFPYSPTSLRFDYRAKVNKEDTLGGKVIQVFGTVVDALTITSFFRDVDQQRRWHDFITDLMKAQSSRQEARPTYTFEFPHRGYTLHGYITGFTQSGGATPITDTPDVLARQYTLTMALQDDPSPLESALNDSFIRRLSAGFGWEQSEYNGPMGVNDVEAFLNGVTVNEYLALHYMPGGFGILSDAGLTAFGSPYSEGTGNLPDHLTDDLANASE